MFGFYVLDGVYETSTSTRRSPSLPPVCYHSFSLHTMREKRRALEHTFKCTKYNFDKKNIYQRMLHYEANRDKETMI